MIINHSRKFVFVHVPKAAGTSVSVMLSELTTYRDLEIGTGELGQALQETYGKRFGLVKHSPAHRIRTVMGGEDWSNYFTFGFARNPFTRLLSIYHFLKSWDKLPEREAANLKNYSCFEEFLEADSWLQSMGPSGIYRPQSFWLAARGRARTLIVDFVGRQETLADDMQKIARRLGEDVAFPTVRKANVTPSYDRSVEWTEATIAKVVDRYRDDFELLGYPTRPEGY